MIRLVALGIPGDSVDEYEYDEAEITAKEKELAGLKEYLIISVQEKRSQVDNVRNAIQSYAEEMHQQFSKETNFLNRLKADLIEFRERQFNQPSGPDLDNPALDEFYRKHCESTRRSNEKLSAGVSISPHSKRLFKLIARIAHPDKTNKPNLLSLFRIAREAYKLDDAAKLSKVYNCILTRTTWTFLRLEEEVQELRVQEALTQRELEASIESDVFNMMQDYRSRIPHLIEKSRNFHLSLLQAEIIETLQKLHSIDPNRYPIPKGLPAPNPTITGI